MRGIGAPQAAAAHLQGMEVVMEQAMIEAEAMVGVVWVIPPAIPIPQRYPTTTVPMLHQNQQLGPQQAAAMMGTQSLNELMYMWEYFQFCKAIHLHFKLKKINVSFHIPCNPFFDPIW